MLLFLLALKAIKKTVVAGTQKNHEENDYDFNEVQMMPDPFALSCRINDPRNYRALQNDTFTLSAAFQR